MIENRKWFRREFICISSSRSLTLFVPCRFSSEVGEKGRFEVLFFGLFRKNKFRYFQLIAEYLLDFYRPGGKWRQVETSGTGWLGGTPVGLVIYLRQRKQIECLSLDWWPHLPCATRCEVRNLNGNRGPSFKSTYRTTWIYFDIIVWFEKVEHTPGSPSRIPPGQ